ncbi:thymidine kinase [Catellatospora sp. TT07R-123]|uniref:thymidine kinase n=1 Tax=Catellatospora sp. TT07R-123 TaxID=2733863 RepID=UPI001B132C81|nr:thymidine kinase [Catellatospora sp. TT07R-123]GHJ44416.1 thymidine kinase [Catellatospora sp. TT07R-123]
MTSADAPSPAPSCNAAGDGRLRHGAALKFFWGPMDCGKSTLALQMDHNHGRQGRRGLVLTRNDRSMGPQVTTRIGLAHTAVEVTDDLDLVDLVRKEWSTGARIDYLICDEACFYTVAQIEQLADLVDGYDVDVYAFGLASDFRSHLFPAARRLFELADEVHRLQVEVLCWCGREGLLNARIVDGVVAREGAQVVIGDTAAADPAEVRYQVLCRRHYRSGDLGR